MFKLKCLLIAIRCERFPLCNRSNSKIAHEIEKKNGRIQNNNNNQAAVDLFTMCVRANTSELSIANFVCFLYELHFHV